MRKNEYVVTKVSKLHQSKHYVIRTDMQLSSENIQKIMRIYEYSQKIKKINFQNFLLGFGIDCSLIGISSVFTVAGLNADNAETGMLYLLPAVCGYIVSYIHYQKNLKNYDDRKYYSFDRCLRRLGIDCEVKKLNEKQYQLKMKQPK